MCSFTSRRIKTMMHLCIDDQYSEHTHISKCGHFFLMWVMRWSIFRTYSIRRRWMFVWTLDADFPVSIYRRRWQTLADAGPEWRLRKIHSTRATWRWSTTLFLDNWLEPASRLNLNVLSLSFYHNLGLCLLHPTILTNSFFRQVSGQITAGLTCTRHWWTCARLHRGPSAASTPTRSRQVCFQGNNPIN